MSRQEIRLFVIKHCFVNKPYDRDWNVGMTLGGSDINESAETIEKAYMKMTDRIATSPYLKSKVETYPK